MAEATLFRWPNLPASIKNSILLIFISIGISFASGTAHLSGIFTVAEHRQGQHVLETGLMELEGLLVLHTVVALLLALLIRSGREWPRYIYATFMALTVIPIAMVFCHVFPDQPWFFAGASFASAALLFVPSSNRYYEARQRERYSYGR